MSFRDVSLPREKPRFATMNNTNAATAPTKISNMNMMRSLSVPMTNPPVETSITALAPVKKKTRPIVLHGKVLNVIDSEAVGTHKTYARLRMERTVARQEETVRQTFERRSAFSQLTHETQQFQKLVADLEGVLDQSGESPEASWKARILIRSAQEAEKDLWDKLYKHEKSLLIPDDAKDKTKTKDKENSQKELRTAQTACMKLHRDFNRGHKALLMVLSLHEKRQKAEVSRLRNIGWSEAEKKDEDFFDRAMREREAELDRMNKSMHKVNEIYNELATMVDGQQHDIDILDDNLRDSKANVQSSMGQVACLFERERFCGAMDFGGPGDDYGSLPTEYTEKKDEVKTGPSFSPPVIRKGEGFDWYMPFENIGEDMGAVHRDIVSFGKEIMQKGEKYTNKSKSSAQSGLGRSKSSQS